MIHFLGNFEAKTDAKGRVFIPALFRKQLQVATEGRIIMRKDTHQPCLVLYSEVIWNEELEELRLHLNKWRADHQQIFRQYVSDVEILTPDSNGRILLPKRYLQLAGISSDVRFIGVDTKIEIWAKEKTEHPFLLPNEFSLALEKAMSEEIINPEQK